MFGQARKSAPLRVSDQFRKRFAARGRLFRCIAAAGLVAMVAGCVDSRPMGGSVEAILAAREAAQTYRLSAGDKVHVAVFNEDNLSGDFVIGPDGRVALPLAGPVQAAGLTLPQFQQAVTARLKDGVVLNPSVAVTASEVAVSRSNSPRAWATSGRRPKSLAAGKAGSRSASASASSRPPWSTIASNRSPMRARKTGRSGLSTNRASDKSFSKGAPVSRCHCARGRPVASNTS